MTHAAPDNSKNEAVHIVVYADGALDVYVHPDKVNYFELEGTPFDPAILAARIEKTLRDIAKTERNSNN